LGPADIEIEKLSKRLRAFTEDQEADAAVALLLRVVNQRLQVFFVKRVESPTDPWSGQMALPGGKREDADENLRQTVARETIEEAGIDILQGCRFLGVIETQDSAVEPKLRVLPFVILLEHEPSIKLSKKELERFAWISLDELLKHKGTKRFSFGEFPAYVIGDNVIWGLTYRTIDNFVRVLRQL
jgi:8-oxo-dGTP diphosphatase